MRTAALQNAVDMHVKFGHIPFMGCGVRLGAVVGCLLVLAACVGTSDVCGGTRCGDNQRCVSGACRLECNTAAECPQSQACEGGVCIAGSGGSSGATSGTGSQGVSSSTGSGATTTSGSSGNPGSSSSSGSACQRAVSYPTSGWEVRQHTLDANTSLGACVDVSQLPTGDWPDDTLVQSVVPGASTRFGLRFTGRRAFAAGISTFTLSHDDGVRLFVDGAPVYDAWNTGIADNVQASTPALTAGEHDVTLEYFQDTGNRMLLVQRVDGCPELLAPAAGWDVQVHTLAADGGVGTCLLRTQLQTQGLNFSDAGGSILPGVPANGVRVTARGLRTLRGLTTVSVLHQGLARVTLNNTPVYTSPGASGTAQVPVYLAGDSVVDVSLEDGSGAASLDLSFQNACDAAPTFPTGGWDVHYHRAVQILGGWSLNLDDCLGVETLSGANLDEQWGGSAAAPVAALGIMDQWGGIYRARRNYAGNTQVTVAFDDGLRVYVGTEISPRMDRFLAPNIETTTVQIPGGGVNVRLEYFEAFGGAGLRYTAP